MSRKGTFSRRPSKEAGMQGNVRVFEKGEQGWKKSHGVTF